MCSSNDNDAGIRYVPSARTVRCEIVTDRGVLWDAYILVQNCATQPGTAPNVAIVHDYTVFDERTGVHVNSASKNRLSH
jgi:hypothetical protein